MNYFLIIACKDQREYVQIMGKYRYCLVSPHSYNSAHNKKQILRKYFFLD